MIQFECAHCRTHYESDDGDVGQTFPCEVCNKPMLVPPRNRGKCDSALTIPFASIASTTSAELIRFDCPHCKCRLTATKEGAGDNRTCPRCHSTITVPAAVETVQMVRFNCPNCQKRLKAFPEESCNSTRCPKCGVPIKVEGFLPASVQPGSRSNTLPAAQGLIKPDERFQFYISPYEALAIEAVAGKEPDAKSILRAKTRLLHEIELCGKVSWLDDFALDKSKAHKFDDEILDPCKARYHCAVFQDKALLRFLTRGEVADYVVCAKEGLHPDAFELFEKDSGFQTFLSAIFARQYNVVLGRAVERRQLPLIKALLDGRRWVVPEDEDTCFEDADKRVREIVDLLRRKADQATERRIDLVEIEDFLRQHSLPDLFNLLPPHFASRQNNAVEVMELLAVASFNKHHDAELSKGVLNLAKRFTCRSTEITNRLDEDLKKVQEKLQEKLSQQHETLSRQRFMKQALAKRRRERLYGWVGLAAIIIIIVVIGSFSDSTKTASSEGTHTRPTTSSPSTYASRGAQDFFLKAQLDTDKQAIDTEKAKLAQMESELDRLSRDIDRDRLGLDQTNQLAIDNFNRKVDAHNRLLDRVKDQERFVNQLVGAYNEKLRNSRK